MTMPSLGASFESAAHAPLERAKTLLIEGKVHQALAALEPANLATALRAAIDEAARQSHAKVSQVEELVDWHAVDTVLHTLGEQISAARIAWGDVPPAAGSLLSGVAEVTMQANQDDVSFYLDRLGEKMARDRHLSAPIDALAATISQWQETLVGLGRAIDESPALRAATVRRALLRGGLAAAAVLVVVPSIFLWIRARAADAEARSAVEAVVASKEPCDVERVDPAQLSAAGPTLVARVEARREVCAKTRAAEAATAKCTALRRAIEGTEPFAALAREAAGDLGDVLGRVGAGKPDRADYAGTWTFPCAETSVAEATHRRLADLARADAALWADPPTLSPAVASELKKKGLSEGAATTLVAQAEKLAGYGVLQGDTSAMDKATVLCRLARDFELTTGRNCQGLEVVLAKKQPAR